MPAHGEGSFTQEINCSRLFPQTLRTTGANLNLNGSDVLHEA